MKLKYYLRGMGIGIILTAIVMGFALGGRRGTLSDAEIIKRAKALGMVEQSSGTLSASLKEEIITNENDASSSGETLDQEGKEISKEEQQTVSSPDQSLSEVASKEEEGEGKNSEGKDVSSEVPTTQEEKKPDVVETIVPQDSAPQVQEDNNTASAEASVSDEPAQEATVSDEPAQEATVSDEPAQQASVEALEPKVIGKTIVIPGGSDSDRVAEILYNEGFVDNAANFNRYLIERGQDRYIRSGTKTIPEGATYEEIAAIITSG